jgi:superfamily II DNA or RNA helicase
LPFTLDIASQQEEIFTNLVHDTRRTRSIVDAVVECYAQGRKVLILTECTDHLEVLADALQQAVPRVFVLHGRMSRKQRAATTSELDELAPNAARILLASGELVGEGFDHPALDTLALAMPVSWKGTLQLYAGRLHREHSAKTDVRILDFIDVGHPTLHRMWEKRLRGYNAMGYSVAPKLR